MTESSTHILGGLSKMSIDRTKNLCKTFGSWEVARDYAKRRIKELQYSLKEFNQKVKE